MAKPNVEIRFDRGRLLFTLKVKRTSAPIRQKKADLERPQSLGDMIRRARLDRNISIQKLSEIFGASVSSIENWENNRNQVSLKFKPKVFEFIGICPFDASLAIGARLKERREFFGLTSNQLASVLGVNPNSVSAWEQGAAKPNSRGIEKIKQFLSTNDKLVEDWE